MPDKFIPDPEHEFLEADIQRLSREIKKQVEKPEISRLAGPEILKKSLSAITPSVKPSAGRPTQPPSLLPDYAQTAPAETKLTIERLLDLAIHQGIEKANTEARKTNPFILDAFHDALATKLYPILKKRGVLK